MDSDHQWMNIHTTQTVPKKKDGWYLKGLFERIIICCLLFIGLYICSYFHVTISDYTTDRVISEIKEDTWVNAVKDKWNDLFHNDEKEDKEENEDKKANQPASDATNNSSDSVNNSGEITNN